MLSAKPYFIPDKGEVAAEMFVFIDAPGAEAHHMVSVNSTRGGGGGVGEIWLVTANLRMGGGGGICETF